MTAARKLSPAESDIRHSPRARPHRIIQVLRELGELYFHVKIINQEPRLTSLANHGGVVLAANHSGMAFPWDSFLMYSYLYEELGGDQKCRFLAAPVLLKSRLMSPFLLDRFWNYYCEPASSKNFEMLMRLKKTVMIHPEGVAGIAKGFSQRYRMQPISSSMVRMCLKFDRPLVPVAIVNGEYLHPHAHSIRVVNTLSAKLGLPFLPFGPMTIPLLLCPFVFYMALPAKLHYIIGSAVDLRTLTGGKSYSQTSDADIRELTKQVQTLMQAHLDANVEKYGAQPFDGKSFWRRFRGHPRAWLRMNPMLWPFQFHSAYVGESSPQGFIERIARVKSWLTCLALCVPVLGWLLVFTMIALQPFRSRHRETFRSE